jgi:hypothetical protein
MHTMESCPTASPLTVAHEFFNVFRFNGNSAPESRPYRGRSVSGGPQRDVVIRTPDQRLRVFVSSTLGELGDERRSVHLAADPFDQAFAAGSRLTLREAVAIAARSN